MNKYIVVNSKGKKTIVYANNTKDAIAKIRTKKSLKKDEHGPSYDWLMEKARNVMYYAKQEDYEKVAQYCENILDGLKNINRL